MIQDGQYILMNQSEFISWLYKQKVSRKITKIQQHHTYSPDYADFNSKPDEIYWMKSMKAAHLKRGFQDIAQHFSTFQNGNICTGRSLELDPAGIFYNNIGAVCIENLINGDTEVMTEAHKKAIVQLTAILCNYFKLEPNTDTIIYHSWFNLTTGARDNEDGGNADANHKTCPSTKFFGGNSVTACRNNFLPLVKQEINLLNNKQESENDIVVDNSFIKMKVVNATILNIRENPDVNAKDIGDLKQNEIITVTGSVGKWFRFSFNGKDAYVHGDYLKDYTEPDYKAEISTLKASAENLNKINADLKDKIAKAINVLK